MHIWFGISTTVRDVEGRNCDAASKRMSEGGANASAVEMNLASEADVGRALQSAFAQAGHLDAVVNNAATAAMGLQETLTAGQARELFAVRTRAWCPGPIVPTRGISRTPSCRWWRCPREAVQPVWWWTP